MRTTTKKYLTCAETAQFVRQTLKQKFPGTKFSVRSRVYSCGASIDVSWTDGPRTREVERIAKAYDGADFDGMIDLKYNKSHYLRPDGAVMIAYDPGTEGSRGCLPAVDNRGLAKVLPAGIQEVHFGADFIFCSRNISDFDTKVAQATAWLYEHYKIEAKTGNPNQDRFGNRWVSDIVRSMIYDHLEGETWEKTFDRS